MFKHAWQEKYAQYINLDEDDAEEGDFETNQAQVFRAGFMEGVSQCEKSIDECKVSLNEAKKLLSKYIKEFEQSTKEFEQSMKDHKKDYNTLKTLLTLILLFR
jgi:cyclopropane fatty-acyl-phospholipid synthase-like methyltransferase